MKPSSPPSQESAEHLRQATDDPTKVWIHGAGGRMGKGIRSIIAEDSAGCFAFAGGSGRTLVEAPRFEGTTSEGTASKGTESEGTLVDQQVLAAALQRAPWDVILDFSVPAGNLVLLNALQASKDLTGALVLGTTGLEPEVRDQWSQLPDKRPGFRLLIAANTSLGILAFRKTLTQMARVLVPQDYDIEMVEAHHKFKLDAPSGTAKMLAKAITDVQAELQPIYNRSGKRQEKELGMHAIRGGGVAGEHEIRFIGPDDEISLSHRAFSRALFAKGALALGRWIRQQKPGLYHVEEIDLGELAVV